MFFYQKGPGCLCQALFYYQDREWYVNHLQQMLNEKFRENEPPGAFWPIPCHAAEHNFRDHRKTRSAKMLIITNSGEAPAPAHRQIRV
ncbi:MAG: hypothetical protein DRI57_31175 [Deltaproteobacteria bacterium]|nr:MAG: hypothetical protein DRI57_31175 [Deltaproteobacteria bacterium]